MKRLHSKFEIFISGYRILLSRYILLRELLNDLSISSWMLVKVVLGVYIRSEPAAAGSRLSITTHSIYLALYSGITVLTRATRAFNAVSEAW